ncbi:hypothetical protein AIOL_002584 [Candidatus Rhodobacter oscarellae]|uniref:Uncharacterized protein n=1 Tax=Candidatus Rhodobacter oscarellae TaxID=1675527 RepID=A0A0J9E772_9RHOB|nr:hypothetical protein [Candidatus Rhodobacter lobularis]KMW57619.1 hypothetical protein AIOL_002584 [Candidatus Rhodobacter lobularis]
MSGYLRFVYGELIEGVGFRAGFLDAAYCLRNDDLTEQTTYAELDRLVVWYKANLPIPEVFSRTSSKGAYHRNTKGLSWFKASAQEHIARAYEVMAILAEHDIAVDVLKSDRVGYIVYEDEWQVVAEPFADTPT